LLYLLAAYVVIASAIALLGYAEARPSYLGIAILAAAAIIHALAGRGEAATVPQPREAQRCARMRAESALCATSP